MHVRRVREADAVVMAALNAHVHELHVAAEPGVYRPTNLADVEKSRRESLRSGQCEGFIAFAGDDAMGHVVFHEVEQPGHGFAYPRAFLMVDELSVVPTLRRQGVGRALMDAVVARARELGVREIQLDVRSHNSGAQAFYESLGYRETKRRLRLGL